MMERQIKSAERASGTALFSLFFFFFLFSDLAFSFLTIATPGSVPTEALPETIGTLYFFPALLFRIRG